MSVHHPAAAASLPLKNDPAAAELGNFAILPLAPRHAEAVAAMAAELSAHEGVEPPKVRPEDVRGELARPDCVLRGFVAEAAGRAVAYVMHAFAFDTETGRRGSFICDLYVMGEARRNGLARALMAAVVRDTAAAGGAWVSWGALSDNEAAKGFYRTLGRIEEKVESWSLNDAAFAGFLEPS